MDKFDLPKSFLKLVNCRKHIYTVALDVGVLRILPVTVTVAVVTITRAMRSAHILCALHGLFHALTTAH